MNKIWIGLFTILLFFGCKKEEEQIPVDPEIQIAEYITEQGLEVTTTASGLRYEFQEEGEGDLPISNSILSLKITGKLADGTVFEQTNSTVESYITTQIAGLQEGFRLMKEGSRATFILPPDIAFGSNSSSVIPANSVIIYEVAVSEIDNRIQETINQYIEDNNLMASETEEGLFHVINNEGEDQRPTLNSNIEINYIGRFTDGEVFDQSGSSTVNFALSNLIRGWQIGIPLMGRGGNALLIVPPQLGYGMSARSGIPGNSVLIFNIDLIDF